MIGHTSTGGENVSQIQSLTDQVNALTFSRDRWNSAYMVFVAVTVVLAAFVFIAQFIAGRKSKKLEEVQSSLIAAKDSQSELDSRAKDVRIADALKQAGESNKAAGEANERAGKAQASLAAAEQQSAEANAKAEAFRLDIAKANEEAARAQAQVAEATAEAAKANLELERIRTPRALTNALELTDSLKIFKGTEYTVIGCFQDQESIDLLTQIDKALLAAGWARKLPTQDSFGDLRLNLAKDFPVPITTRSGIYIGAQSTETVDALRAQLMLPEYIRAAMALKGALGVGINPPEPDLISPLQVDPGTSTSVFIIVGKKP